MTTCRSLGLRPTRTLPVVPLAQPVFPDSRNAVFHGSAWRFEPDPGLYTIRTYQMPANPHGASKVRYDRMACRYDPDRADARGIWLMR